METFSWPNSLREFRNREAITRGTPSHIYIVTSPRSAERRKGSAQGRRERGFVLPFLAFLEARTLDERYLPLPQEFARDVYAVIYWKPAIGYEPVPLAVSRAAALQTPPHEERKRKVSLNNFSEAEKLFFSTTTAIFAKVCHLLQTFVGSADVLTKWGLL